jgi:hypothetical protein
VKLTGWTEAEVDAARSETIDWLLAIDETANRVANEQRG